MRKRLSVFAAVLLLCGAASAQEHHHDMTDAEFLKMLASMSSHGTTRSLATVPTGVTVTIDMTAKSFFFTPSAISVNQGDTVVINLSVPANDPSTSGHGLLMDTYIVPGQNVARGTTKQIRFVASQDGTFAFGCNISSCGVGHSNMVGELTVKKLSNPAPAVTSVAPASGSTDGGTAVTIKGSNFAAGAGVTFGGVAAASVTVTDSTTILASTPPAAAPGAVPVVVANPDGQSASFSSFTYTLPPPAITAVAPATGPTSGGTPITINGNGFVRGAKVTVGGGEAGLVNVVSAATITAIAPLGPASEQVGQPLDVVVTNPDGTRITRSRAFTYFVPPLAVTSIFASSSLPAGGVEVSISGAGFTTAVSSSVTFGGLAATNVRVLDAVTMHATVPAHAAGSVDVSVTVGDKTVTVSNGFSYAVPPTRKRAAGH